MNAIESDDRGVIVSCSNCGQRNRLAYERLGEAARCPACREEIPPPAKPVELENEVQFDALTMRSALPVLVDFWAPWCGPCKMVAPEVAKAAASGGGRWVVAKLNTEELPAVAQQHGVSAIPLFVLFHRGREIARQSGAMPEPTLRGWVERALHR